jgi:hypothetical protein
VKYLIVTAAFFITTSVFAQSDSQLKSQPYADLINKGLDHVLNLQKKEDNGEVYWNGEWSTEMVNLRSIIALGPKGKTASDSNCFSTALTHNELAKYVLRNNVINEKIANSLSLAISNILTFRTEGNTFNFWHKVSMTDVIRNKTRKEHQDKIVSRPNNYELKNTFAAVRSNIADDADDTAVAYSAIYFNNILYNKYSDIIQKAQWSPSEVEQPFDKYRDLNRKGANPFNRVNGIKKNTGAYLTWLTEQNSSFMGSVFKGWKDNLRIPEGSNNVDCIVNANVLQMLSQYNINNSDGASAACRFIEKSIDTGIVKKCGVYYPNPYHLHFSVSQAYESGAACLKKSAEKLFVDLKQSQNQNGSWGYSEVPKKDNIKHITDPVSSSIYASNAFFIYLKLLGTDTSAMRQADLAAKYLAETAQYTSEGSVFWNAGVFFSGGTFVRRMLVWKSEAYTSMLAVQALDRYQHLQDSGL